MTHYPQSVPFRLLRAALVVSVVVSGRAVSADETPASPPPTITRLNLTITPMAPPSPVLRYELLPPLRDRKPGNRATYYLRAVVQWNTVLSEEVRQQYIEVLRANDGPISEFNAEDVRALLPHFEQILNQLEKGVVRDRCDWDLDVQYVEGWDAVSYSLEEFQQMREFARILSMKGRLEVVEGRFDDAIATLQMGYQLARDVAQPPTLINSLIGIAFTAIMDSVVRAWIDQPDAPNLYWALATRPRPFLSLRESLQFEAGLTVRMFPVLRDPESTQRSDAEWNRLVRELVVDVGNLDNYWMEGRPLRTADALAAADQVIAEALPIARRELLEAEFDDATLDGMSDGQLLAIHTSRVVRELSDRFVTVLCMPPFQADRFIGELEQEIEIERKSTTSEARRESLPVFSKLVPSLRPANVAWIRMQQRFDALQCIEAIRAYAAAHDGQLPTTLADSVDTPCPLNVLTGQLFPYEVEDGVATLTVPPLPPRLPQTGREYVVRVE